MLILLAICHGLLVLGFTARILIRDDISPPARTAWFIVLNLVPYFGSAVYFLFGETDIGHRASQRYKEIFKETRLVIGRGASSAPAVPPLIDPEYQPAYD